MTRNTLKHILILILLTACTTPQPDTATSEPPMQEPAPDAPQDPSAPAPDDSEPPTSPPAPDTPGDSPEPQNPENPDDDTTPSDTPGDYPEPDEPENPEPEEPSEPQPTPPDEPQAPDPDEPQPDEPEPEEPLTFTLSFDDELNTELVNENDEIVYGVLEYFLDSDEGKLLQTNNLELKPFAIHRAQFEPDLPAGEYTVVSKWSVGDDEYFAESTYTQAAPEPTPNAGLNIQLHLEQATFSDAHRNAVIAATEDFAKMFKGIPSVPVGYVNTCSIRQTSVPSELAGTSTTTDAVHVIIRSAPLSSFDAIAGACQVRKDGYPSLGLVIIDSEHTLSPAQLYSLHLHELGHVFGYGLSRNWTSLVDYEDLYGTPTPMLNHPDIRAAANSQGQDEAWLQRSPRHHLNESQFWGEIFTPTTYPTDSVGATAIAIFKELGYTHTGYLPPSGHIGIQSLLNHEHDIREQLFWPE